MNDITVVYYTANVMAERFMSANQEQLIRAAGGAPIISVSQKPMELGENICVGDIGVHTVNIYRQALVGAKASKTKYIGLAEDDALYSPEHFFCHRPAPDVFAYNGCVMNMYTWIRPPLFTYKGRRNLHALICERDLFIQAMEERFAKYPTNDMVRTKFWGEPGRHENHLGVPEHKSEMFYPALSNIAFSHPYGIGFTDMGKRKRMGLFRITGLLYWGTAQEVLDKYYGPDDQTA